MVGRHPGGLEALVALGFCERETMESEEKAIHYVLEVRRARGRLHFSTRYACVCVCGGVKIGALPSTQVKCLPPTWLDE